MLPSVFSPLRAHSKIIHRSRVSHCGGVWQNATIALKRNWRSAKGRPKAYFRENRDAVQKEELTITNRLVLALSLAVCTLGLSVSGNAQGPRITTFNDPSAGTAAGQGTYPLAINPSGPITGISVDANNLNHGFLRGPDGGFITFEAPGIGTGAWQGTIPYAVNPSG